METMKRNNVSNPKSYLKKDEKKLIEEYEYI